MSTDQDQEGDSHCFEKAVIDGGCQRSRADEDSEEGSSYQKGSEVEANEDFVIAGERG